MHRGTQVIDCFKFFNELRVLNWRLHELDPVVDRFLLLEATKTYTGSDKPLYFAENAARFVRFRHKIIHIVVDDLPDHGGHWDRDCYQSLCIYTRGLSRLNLADDDILVLSDLDEVVDPRVILDIKAGRLSLDKRPLRVRPAWFLYNWGCYFGPSHHASILITTFKRLRILTWPNAWFRRFQDDDPPNSGGSYELLERGWHASYFMSPKAILYKLNSYAHADDGKDLRVKAAGLGFIREKMRAGQDLFGILRRRPRGPLPLPRYAHLALPQGSLPRRAP
jgi:beta-1,4-mannosyl-glycoprotein beta-1,4-N-acetylglucosaminyltransferase